MVKHILLKIISQRRIAFIGCLQKKWRSGFRGSGFKPALVRRDVAMKLFSDSMGGFPSPHLDMPGLGQGLHSRP